MAGVLVDNGESVMLQLITNKIATPEDLVLRLFKNDVTPGETDVAGTYTEADFTGYSAITLTGASWTVSGTAPTSISFAQQTFTSSADQTAQTIFGAYTTRASTGDLIHAERFSSSTVVQSNGDAVKVTPTLTQS